VYSIVDIETTGNGIKGNRITEISIFKYDGHELVDEFTSLVNPECEIPHFITGLTGIDNAMVRDAPKLNEIASKILKITNDTIFVAHSVNFDYNVIKNELKGINIEFSRKKLCTVRLSRKLLPGYNSYSLGKLCSAIGIPLTDRHRARGDAHATMLLFHKLLRAQGAEKIFKSFLNARSQEATLPPALPKEEFEKLPSTPGVYYFKNAKGGILYVGKAINIKKRVLSHFYDKSNKELALCNETHELDFEETGNELVALLYESGEIKKHFPKYNRAQKKIVKQYAIFSYEDRSGIIHLAHNQLKLAPNPLHIFYNITDCRAHMEKLCDDFGLCPKYCHLQENVPHCSHFRLNRCSGICKDIGYLQEYNSRVHLAISSLKEQKNNYIIKGKGRTTNEDTVVLVKNSLYAGYGFVPQESQITSYKNLEPYLKLQENTMESQRIVSSYAFKYPKSVLEIEKDVWSMDCF